jgi:hypothetical protein
VEGTETRAHRRLRPALSHSGASPRMLVAQQRTFSLHVAGRRPSNLACGQPSSSIPIERSGDALAGLGRARVRLGNTLSSSTHDRMRAARQALLLLACAAVAASVPAVRYVRVTGYSTASILSFSEVAVFLSNGTNAARGRPSTSAAGNDGDLGTSVSVTSGSGQRPTWLVDLTSSTASIVNIALYRIPSTFTLDYALVEVLNASFVVVGTVRLPVVSLIPRPHSVSAFDLWGSWPSPPGSGFPTPTPFPSASASSAPLTSSYPGGLLIRDSTGRLVPGGVPTGQPDSTTVTAYSSTSSNPPPPLTGNALIIVCVVLGVAVGLPLVVTSIVFTCCRRQRAQTPPPPQRPRPSAQETTAGATAQGRRLPGGEPKPDDDPGDPDSAPPQGGVPDAPPSSSSSSSSSSAGTGIGLPLPETGGGPGGPRGSTSAASHHHVAAPHAAATTSHATVGAGGPFAGSSVAVVGLDAVAVDVAPSSAPVWDDEDPGGGEEGAQPLPPARRRALPSFPQHAGVASGREGGEGGGAAADAAAAATTSSSSAATIVPLTAVESSGSPDVPYKGGMDRGAYGALSAGAVGAGAAAPMPHAPFVAQPAPSVSLSLYPPAAAASSTPAPVAAEEVPNAGRRLHARQPTSSVPLALGSSLTPSAPASFFPAPAPAPAPAAASPSSSPSRAAAGTAAAASRVPANHADAGDDDESDFSTLPILPALSRSAAWGHEASLAGFDWPSTCATCTNLVRPGYRFVLCAAGHAVCLSCAVAGLRRRGRLRSLRASTGRDDAGASLLCGLAGPPCPLPVLPETLDAVLAVCAAACTAADAAAGGGASASAPDAEVVEALRGVPPLLPEDIRRTRSANAPPHGRPQRASPHGLPQRAPSSSSSSSAAAAGRGLVPPPARPLRAVLPARRRADGTREGDEPQPVSSVSAASAAAVSAAATASLADEFALPETTLPTAARPTPSASSDKHCPRCAAPLPPQYLHHGRHLHVCSCGCPLCTVCLSLVPLLDPEGDASSSMADGGGADGVFGACPGGCAPRCESEADAEWEAAACDCMDCPLCAPGRPCARCPFPRGCPACASPPESEEDRAARWVRRDMGRAVRAAVLLTRGRVEEEEVGMQGLGGWEGEEDEKNDEEEDDVEVGEEERAPPLAAAAEAAPPHVLESSGGASVPEGEGEGEGEGGDVWAGLLPAAADAPLPQLEGGR